MKQALARTIFWTWPVAIGALAGGAQGVVVGAITSAIIWAVITVTP